MKTLALAALLTLGLAQTVDARQLCPKCDSLFAWMDDPTWWAQNPTARRTQLQACAERRHGTEPMMRYCGPAARSAQITRNR